MRAKSKPHQPNPRGSRIVHLSLEPEVVERLEEMNWHCEIFTGLGAGQQELDLDHPIRKILLWAIRLHSSEHRNPETEMLNLPNGYASWNEQHCLQCWKFREMLKRAETRKTGT